MTGAVSGIDHLVVDTDDLDGARDVWARLGFTMTPRGRHPQWGTGNYCTMFENDYLELIGVVDPSELAANAAHRGERKQGRGLSAVAFASKDAEASAATLREAGIEPDDPKDLSRLLEGDEGTSEPRFHILHLPADATPLIPMFLCRHLTPELVRRPDWLRHPNGARRIASVVIPAAEPLSSVAALERLFGGAAVAMTDNTVTVRAGGQTVVFASHDDLNALYPDLLPVPGEARCPAVVTLAVNDLGNTAGHLAKSGVPILRDAASVMVAAEDACGIALVFES
ncbi:MAG: VOC family protein [Rhodospirillales bacterium]|nr:VOC family protein [Rhodospirillales bacterium]